MEKYFQPFIVKTKKELEIINKILSESKNRENKTNPLVEPFNPDLWIKK